MARRYLGHALRLPRRRPRPALPAPRERDRAELLRDRRARSSLLGAQRVAVPRRREDVQVRRQLLRHGRPPGRVSGRRGALLPAERPFPQPDRVQRGAAARGGGRATSACAAGDCCSVRERPSRTGGDSPVPAGPDLSARRRARRRGRRVTVAASSRAWTTISTPAAAIGGLFGLIRDLNQYLAATGGPRCSTPPPLDEVLALLRGRPHPGPFSPGGPGRTGRGDGATSRPRSWHWSRARGRARDRRGTGPAPTACATRSGVSAGHGRTPADSR